MADGEVAAKGGRVVAMESPAGSAEGVVLESIEAALGAVIDDAGLPGNLAEACRYAVLGGGKRLRPMLAWRACEAVGAPGDRAVWAGCAVELVHAFSLVHDDLPAMDDDDLRRGRPTLHRHAGEAMAILAGDQLLTLAFAALTRHGREGALSARLLGELVEGTTGMIAGQVYDTLGGHEGAWDGVRQVRETHRRKTGALIRAACRMGAIAGGAEGAALEGVTRYGEAVGLMFQVVDDLIDVTQSSEHAGKRTGKDADAGKLTYPGVLGVEASREEVARLRIEALAAVEVLGPGADGLRRLCERMAVRTA